LVIPLPDLEGCVISTESEPDVYELKSESIYIIPTQECDLTIPISITCPDECPHHFELTLNNICSDCDGITFLNHSDYCDCPMPPGIYGAIFPIPECIGITTTLGNKKIVKIVKHFENLDTIIPSVGAVDTIGFCTWN